MGFSVRPSVCPPSPATRWPTQLTRDNFSSWKIISDDRAIAHADLRLAALA